MEGQAAPGVRAEDVAEHPVGHRLDQRRPVAAARAVDGLAHRLVHGEHVVAVDGDAGNAVGRRTRGDLAQSIAQSMLIAGTALFAAGSLLCAVSPGLGVLIAGLALARLTIDALPTTINGKLDVRALPAPQYGGAEAYQAPGDPVEEINELEWVDGVIWANVWHSDEILRIDPSTGHVTGVIDASALWEAPERTAEMTLNGIAHRPGDPPNRLWLTGKNWPEMFEVEVTER